MARYWIKVGIGAFVEFMTQCIRYMGWYFVLLRQTLTEIISCSTTVISNVTRFVLTSSTQNAMCKLWISGESIVRPLQVDLWSYKQLLQKDVQNLEKTKEELTAFKL